MGNDDTVTIRVSKDTWRKLNACKQGPSDSFDDVLRDLFEGEIEGNPNAPTMMAD